MKKIILFLLALLLLFSCSMGFEQQFYTSTLDMILGSYNVSRAAIPFSKIQQGLSFENGVLDDYPEAGQTTNWKVTNQGNNLYKLEVKTLYGYSEYISNTIEIYYVYDIDRDNKYTIIDPVYNPNTMTIDNKYREKFQTTFNNSDLRDEVITTINDSSAFPSQFNMSLNYSSIVEYEQTYFELSAKKIRLTGTRYYGEHSNGSRTVIIEKGSANNLYIEKLLRGKTTINGTIVIDINLDGEKIVSGEYTFTTKTKVYTYEVNNSGIIYEK